MTDPTNLARFAPNRCVSTQAAPTCSPTSAREREAQEIASDILAKLDNPDPSPSTVTGGAL